MTPGVWHWLWPLIALAGLAALVLCAYRAVRAVGRSQMARLRPRPVLALRLPGAEFYQICLEGGRYWEHFQAAQYAARDARGGEVALLPVLLRLRREGGGRLQRWPVKGFVAPDDGVLELELSGYAPQAEDESWIVIQRETDLLVYLWAIPAGLGFIAFLIGAVAALSLWAETGRQAGVWPS